MLSNNPKAISIWFVIGLQLVIYGILITIGGIMDFVSPPAVPLAMSQYHAGVWWGIILLVLGLYYTLSYLPGHNKHVL
jgi:hypothetical protein